MCHVTKILQCDCTALCSAVGHGLYTLYTRPFPSFVEVDHSFPDHIFHARQKNRSGQLPIPFSFKCARMLIGTLFFSNLILDVIKDCIPHCMPTIY